MKRNSNSTETGYFLEVVIYIFFSFIREWRKIEKEILKKSNIPHNCNRKQQCLNMLTPHFSTAPCLCCPEIIPTQVREATTIS